MGRSPGHSQAPSVGAGVPSAVSGRRAVGGERAGVPSGQMGRDVVQLAGDQGGRALARQVPRGSGGRGPQAHGLARCRGALGDDDVGQR
ncbi:hypothetical protein [Streptomyces puniciscabiei]|uniref:hypothetical protein n=1 Tax=Streptomyces puniciscabiei TaxID=164348 RepID=UPI00142EBB15|nr:hypothetical protein [Streptomyces puniciscabiei]